MYFNQGSVPGRLVPSYEPLIWATREFLECDITSLDGGIHYRNTIDTITIWITIRKWTRQNHIFVIVKFYFAAFAWKFAVSKPKNHYLLLFYKLSTETALCTSLANHSHSFDREINQNGSWVMWIRQYKSGSPWKSIELRLPIYSLRSTCACSKIE